MGKIIRSKNLIYPQVKERVKLALFTELQSPKELLRQDIEILISQKDKVILKELSEVFFMIQEEVPLF